MNTVLFVNATIGFSENLFLVCFRILCSDVENITEPPGQGIAVTTVLRYHYSNKSSTNMEMTV